ncbi:Flp family type IVb pilin [Agromyces mariniharenae]|uniref:Flp family type IVb pilin n=1 Tax=Agromyces mariniharenae TaxID=2604423 RepID=A0A5S4V234_9MICO|nr:Flp family type IVb pilin [Agromyces mariniharenae]TYL53197.1 Flp family type IVb pilin [Agromyces mariniharenae]
MLKAYSRLQARLNSVRSEEEGATAVEYALIIGLVSLALIAAAFLLIPGIQNLFGDISTALNGATVPTLGPAVPAT